MKHVSRDNQLIRRCTLHSLPCECMSAVTHKEASEQKFLYQ